VNSRGCSVSGTHGKKGKIPFTSAQGYDLENGGRCRRTEKKGL